MQMSSAWRTISAFFAASKMGSARPMEIAAARTPALSANVRPASLATWAQTFMAHDTIIMLG